MSQDPKTAGRCTHGPSTPRNSRGRCIACRQASNRRRYERVTGRTTYANRGPKPAKGWTCPTCGELSASWFCSTICRSNFDARGFWVRREAGASEEVQS